MNIFFPKTAHETSLRDLVSHLRTVCQPADEGILTVYGECSGLHFEADKGSTHKMSAVDCRLDVQILTETFEVYGLGWCPDGHPHSMKMLQDCQLINFSATFTPYTKRILALPVSDNSPAKQNDETSHKPGISWGDLTNMSHEPKKVSTTRKVTKEESQFNFENLRPMDTVVHPAFGDCKVVQRLNRGKLKIRKPNGSLADLHIKLFSIQDHQRRNNRSRVSLSLNGKDS